MDHGHRELNRRVFRLAPRMRPRPLLAAALLVTLVAGCGTSGPTPGSPSPPAGIRSPAAGPSNANATSGALGTSLRDSIDPGAMLDDLAQLASITEEHGGSRPAGSDGYRAAADWAAGILRDAGFDVQLDSLTVPLFTQQGPATLAIGGPGAPALVDGRDFKAMLLSPPGDVTAPVFALGYDPAAHPGDRSGMVCGEGSWANVPRGSIVLVQPGPCRARTIAEHAQAAGAAALVSAYPEWGPGEILRPTLIDPGGLRIPVIGASHDAGVALAAAAAAGPEVQVHLDVAATTSQVSSDNVIAETPGGDPDHVVMVGGHLDSVIDGPGINDNGSGVATILEIARQLATGSAGQPARKVRVALFTGEELGLWGSVHYANALDDAGRAAILAYLNFDMLGSPNGVRQVYDGGTLQSTGSTVIASLFQDALDADGLAWETTGVGGASDGYRFDQLGIPVGGLFSGASERKSADQAARFGGTAGEAFDACYHLACDTLDNIDATLLWGMSRAAAAVVGELAGGSVDLER
jgi:hypothetical protein